MVTCVGSLTHLSLRMAGQPNATKIHEKSTTWEILSLVGTLSSHKDSHLHLCVSDNTGKTLGGHVMEGNIVHTTAEIVIQEPLDLKFHRVLDGATPWGELRISKRFFDYRKKI